MNIQDLIYSEERTLHEVADRVRPLAVLCEVSPSGFCSIILHIYRKNYQVPFKNNVSPSEEGSFRLEDFPSICLGNTNY